VQIARLYPDRPSETFRHARALLNFIGKECPDFIGFYIPKTDLERTYQELCAAEAWKIRHWTAIARHLGCITKKREVKREGVRFVAYQIPRKMFR
jgi:antirestriction protein